MFTHLVCAQLYEWVNHGGNHVDVNNGGNPTVLGNFWNDRVSSIIVMANCTLTLYEHSDFRGTNVKYIQSIALLDPAWDDETSSYDCVCNYSASGFDFCFAYILLFQIIFMSV